MNASMITAAPGDMELGKRFPIFAVIIANCPKCGETAKCDGATEDYPVPGRPFDVQLYCEPCDDYFAVPIVIELKYRLATPEDQ